MLWQPVPDVRNVSLSPVYSPCAQTPGRGVLGLCQALQGTIPTTDASLCQELHSPLWTLRLGRFQKLPVITRGVRGGGTRIGAESAPPSLCLSPSRGCKSLFAGHSSWPFSAQGHFSRSRLAEPLSCRSRESQAAETRSGWRKSGTQRHQSFRATLSETGS